MNTRFLGRALAIVLTIALVAPSAFLAVPQKVYAVLGAGDTVIEVGPSGAANIKTSVESTISAIKNTLTEVHTYTSMVATYAGYVNTYVLQPLAFVMSGNLLKGITAATISFVTGKTNGTGAAQFVQNQQGHLQAVGDTQASAFFTQFSKNSNSPFAAAISSSLRNNYLQNTSMAGFWSANQCTLAKSADMNRFLAGDWSRGGAAAWFALTTQDQNNPYTFYQNSQNKLATLIGSPSGGGAVGARAAQINQGQGMLPWCGAKTKATETAASTEASCQSCLMNCDNLHDNDNEAANSCKEQCAPQCGGGSSSVFGKLQDMCTKKDGSPGSVKTPGSVISASLNKSMGTTQDKLVSMGSVAKEVNGILGDITNVMNTVNFATKILGGPGSGGLFGSEQTSGTDSVSPLRQYQATPGYMGVTQSTVYQNAATLSPAGANLTKRVAQYKSAWDTIGASATKASASVTDLITYCSEQQKSARDTIAADDAYLKELQVMTLIERQSAKEAKPPLTDAERSNLKEFIQMIAGRISEAQSAFTDKVSPVVEQAASAAATIEAANVLAQKVQDQLISGSATTTASASYTDDMQELLTTSPTPSEVGTAQQNAQSFGTAKANPEGTLKKITGDSLLDKMDLINGNADAYRNNQWCDEAAFLKKKAEAAAQS